MYCRMRLVDMDMDMEGVTFGLFCGEGELESFLEFPNKVTTVCNN